MFSKLPLKTTAAAVATAATLALGTTASASPVLLDDTMQGRVVELGLDLSLFDGLDEAWMAQIAALFDADHDDAALKAAIAAILEQAEAGTPAG